MSPLGVARIAGNRNLALIVPGSEADSTLSAGILTVSDCDPPLDPIVSLGEKRFANDALPSVAPADSGALIELTWDHAGPSTSFSSVMNADAMCMNSKYAPTVATEAATSVITPEGALRILTAEARVRAGICSRRASS